MIHYWIETGLWIAGLFLLGCPLGAAARWLFARPAPPEDTGLSGDA